MKRILIDGKPSMAVLVEASEDMRCAQAEWVTAVSKWRAMLAASDPALTEAVVEMREALAQMVRDWASDDPTAEGQDVVNRARAALARVTVEASDG